MAKCERCGRELAAGEVCSCLQQQNGPDFSKYFQLTFSRDALDNVKKMLGTIRETISGVGEEFTSGVGGAYENNMQITDECVVPTEQEIPVRQYNVAKLRTPLWKKAYGRLQVTNKRVLFRAKGRSLAGPIEIENEFSLEEIGGVEIKTDYRFNLLIFLLSTLALFFSAGLYLVLATLVLSWSSKTIIPFVILTVLTTLIALAMLILVRSKLGKAIATICTGAGWVLLGNAVDTGFWTGVGAVFMIISVVMWILSALVDDLHILIKIKGAHGAIEIGRKLRNDERSGFSVVQPWKDTQLAIRELGALIDDVKRFGNAGIEKWKV